MGLALPAALRADPVARLSTPAADAVREALQREIYGLETDRRELLAAAAEQAPQYGPARWHLGFVQDGKHGWLQHEAVLQSPKLFQELTAYERQRSKAFDTVAGQLALAEWCREHELADQARAHLTRVIDLNPDHALARAHLGFVRQNGGWVSSAEINRDATQESARQAALRVWQPRIAAIRKDLEHRSQERREFAQNRLAEIVDPAAVPAIEAVFADASEDVAVHALDALAKISDPEASLALARFAAYSPGQTVREAAAKRLGKRELESYVPQILASMYSPLVSRFMAVTLPTGRIGYRHAFVRETHDRQELLLLDTEYRRQALIGGSRGESTSRALDQAADLARQREQAAAAQNEWINRVNDRLAWVLQTATGQNLPAAPEAWWNWWNERNEVFLAGSKPVNTIQQTSQVTIVDSVLIGTSGQLGTSGSSTPTPQTHECLAAGTLVWTVKGPWEIDQVRVGDLVLAQHPETGELAFKPVLRTTVRPKGRLINLQSGGESCQCSGGHPFWVAGEGWVKARELRSGQVLHGAMGPVQISSVEPSIEAETYNLVVADFHTYFVGYRKVLSHDNSVRAPTRAIVPGLTPQ
ncbi:MAG TPA: polymorphic toxin-type HINT domain-containing protein [Pirellulaceae bacterium]|nr:polymorphic toxin-type HINT domain-containing protein [Pirellulaceae bacterium]